MSYPLNWKTHLYGFGRIQSTTPVIHEKNGDDLYANIKDYKTRNQFTRYLKAVLGAKDPHIYYFLWEEGDWDPKKCRKKYN